MHTLACRRGQDALRRGVGELVDERTSTERGRPVITLSGVPEPAHPPRQVIREGFTGGPPVLVELAARDPHAREVATKQAKLDAMFQLMMEDFVDPEEIGLSPEELTDPLKFQQFKDSLLVAPSRLGVQRLSTLVSSLRRWKRWHWNCHAVWGALPPVQRSHVPPPGESWGTDSCSVDVACDGMVCHQDGPAVSDHPLPGPSIPDAWAYPFWCSSLWAGTMGTRELGYDGQSRPGFLPFGFGIHDPECRIMYTVWTHAAEQPGAMWPRLPRVSDVLRGRLAAKEPGLLTRGLPQRYPGRVGVWFPPSGTFTPTSSCRTVASCGRHFASPAKISGRSRTWPHSLWIGRCLVPASWNFFVERCWKWRWSRVLPRQLDTIACGAFSQPLGMCWLWTEILCRL